MSFGGLILTNLGRQELAKAETGQVLTFDYVAIGDGEKIGAATAVEELTNELYQLPVLSVIRKGDTVIVETDMTNAELETGFYFREVGLYANGVLYAYDNAGTEAEYIDSASSAVAKSKRIRLALMVSSEAEITVKLDAGLYALQKDLIEHLNGENPHGVTAEQAGAADKEHTHPAANIVYDNTNSGLVATDMQAAIDEVNSIPFYTDELGEWIAGESADACLMDVAYSNGMFVAVGVSGVAYSTDGKTWATNEITGQLYAITYGNGIFVAVGNLCILYSTDGKSWTKKDIRNTTFYGVTYGNGRFIAVGDNAICYSTDGKTWNVSDTIDTKLNDVAYGNDTFVAVGDSGITYYSTDGSYWTEGTTISSKDIKAITYGNGKFVAVGDGGAVYHSTDGTFLWLCGIFEITDPNITIPDMNFSDVKFGKNTFIAVGDDCIAKSPTGESWTFCTSVTDDSTGVAYGNEKFVIVDGMGCTTYAEFKKEYRDLEEVVLEIKDKTDNALLKGENAVSATKATQDGDGNVITHTYATKAEMTESAYTHPTESGNKHIPSGGSSGQLLRWSEDGTAVWESPSDSSASSTFSSSSTKLITERDAYYGTPNFNGGKKSNSTTLYAPTSAGISGQLLQSNGSGAPSWKTVITDSSAITTSGKYALDAVEKNASVEGTLAYQIDVLGNAELLGTVNSPATGTTTTINIANVANYRYVVIHAIADGYCDYKIIPVSLRNVRPDGGNRGCYLKIYATSTYYWEGNVGFESDTAIRVYTIGMAGWNATIGIYGIK